MLITSGANIATVKVEKHRVSFCQRFWIDSEGREFEKQWCPLATIYKDFLKEGERLGSDLQGEFSTIKLPLRLRERIVVL